MYRFALLVVAVTLLTSSIAQAASYKKTDGTVVDPIMNTFGNPHGYSGNNLEPEANQTAWSPTVDSIHLGEFMDIIYDGSGTVWQTVITTIGTS